MTFFQKEEMDAVKSFQKSRKVTFFYSQFLNIQISRDFIVDKCFIIYHNYLHVCSNSLMIKF